MAVLLSSITIGLDASQYAEGARAKVDADRAMVDSGAKVIDNDFR
jgi:hypothetical protein